MPQILYSLAFNKFLLFNYKYKVVNQFAQLEIFGIIRLSINKKYNKSQPATIWTNHIYILAAADFFVLFLKLGPAVFSSATLSESSLSE